MRIAITAIIITVALIVGVGLSVASSVKTLAETRTPQDYARAAYIEAGAQENIALDVAAREQTLTHQAALNTLHL